MSIIRSTIVLTVFGLITYLVLNWLLTIHWNWSFIGHVTIAFFASVVAIFIGSVVAGLFTLLPDGSAKSEFIGH